MRLRLLFVLTLTVGSLFGGAAPTVFWVGDPVHPNDTVMVTGADFGVNPCLWLIPVRRESGALGGVRESLPTWPEGGGGVDITPLQATPHSLKAVIPTTQTAGAWCGRIENRDTGVSSAVFRINGPTVYWMQGDAGSERASPGGWIRVFGRCLADMDASATVALVADDAAAPPIRLVPERGSLWDVQVAVPDSLGTGRWGVFVHNGWGGENGWTAAGQMDIRPVDVWPQRVFNVRDLGASGLGDWDDVVALQAALTAADTQGGGVVFLPRGRYLFEGTLKLPRHTVLRGEGRELTSLCWPDTEEPYTLVAGTDHFGVEDITLYASNYVHGIAADLDTPEAGYTHLRNVCLRAVIYRGHLTPDQVDERFRATLKHSTGGGDSIRLGGENVVVSGCDIYGSGRAFYLYGVRGGNVSDNRFYNGRWGWYCITGADGLIHENNVLTGADLMSTGGGINCLGSVYSRNVYYADNTVARCHGWDREAMTSDAGGGPYYGPVAAVDGVRLQLPEKPDWGGASRWRGAAVFILGGRGMGQYRRIESIATDDMTLSLEAPWQVEPDATSVVTVTMLQENYIFAGNHFEDTGMALQYYGTSIDHVAWGNSSVRAGGFYNSGRWYHGYQPSWYCQFLENEIGEGNCYRFGADNSTAMGPSFIGTLGLQYGENTAPLAYAGIHRRNILRNNAMIRLAGVSDEAPGLCDVVVEHNTIANSEVALDMGPGCLGVLCRENMFEKVDQITFDAAAARERRMARRSALMAQKGPVYVQDFETRTGRFFPDASGNGLVAHEREGTVSLETGPDGQCGRFDGKGFLQINDTSLLRFPEVTVSAWVLPDSVAGRWGVVAKRNANTACAYVMALTSTGVSFEATDVRGRWSYNLHASVALTTGQWHHIAVTCAEGAMVQVYCDGTMVASKPVEGEIVDDDQPVTIGFEAWGGPDSRPNSSGNFRGVIDDVKIWSRVLTPDELRQEHERLRLQAQADAERRGLEAQQRETEKQRLAERFRTPPGATWSLLVADDFQGDTLAPRWLELKGAWQQHDGVLRCREVSFLALDRTVSLPVRIEFDARSSNPSDLTAFLGTKAEAYAGGYFVGFASNNNTANKILRLGHEVARNEEPTATPDTWHHVVCEILASGEVNLAIDGKPVLQYRDPDPVTTADTAGILAWGDAEFDNLRIFVHP